MEDKMITKPKGTYDLLDIDARIYTYISNLAEEFMHNYNIDYIRTPIFEASELFHRGIGGTTDIVTKETYDFKDRGDRQITLRPEGTAGVVRSVIENKLYGNRNDVLKYYYMGTMYRYERPQKGRFRELTQIGVEAFNSNEPMIDAEIISLGYYFIKSLGIEDFTVQINTLGDETSRTDYTKALKDYLKPHLEGLCEDCKSRFQTNPLRILDCKVDKDNEILKKAPRISAFLTKDAKERFDKVKEYLNILDIDYSVNENIVRGLDYYDHNVWEYVTDTEKVAIGGGGRYNSLVENLGGPSLPAVGFGLGVDRLILEIKKILPEKALTKQIDAYVMCVNEEEKMHAVSLVQDLRLNNIQAEINSNNLSLKSQFKIADTLGAKYLIILNSDDLQKGIITVKENSTKEEFKLDESEVVDWLIGNL